SKWQVTSRDGKVTFGTADTAVQAYRLRDALLVREPEQKRDAGKFVITLPDDPGPWTLGQFASEEEATKALANLSTVRDDRTKHVRAMIGSAAVGLIVGALGAFAVWNRSRRTPDVIAAHGV